MRTQREIDMNNCCYGIGCRKCNPEKYEYVQCQNCKEDVLNRDTEIIDGKFYCEDCLKKRCVECGKFEIDEISMKNGECITCQKLDEQSCEYNKIWNTASELKERMENFFNIFKKSHGEDNFEKYINKEEV